MHGDGVEGPVEANGPEEEEPEEMRTQGAPQRGRKLPVLPSMEEQMEHYRTHLPFRSWCKWCVQGRKPNWAHYSLPQEVIDDRGPEVHMDYCFFREAEGRPNVACLIVKCRKSRALAAHVVPYKGAGVEWVVAQVGRDLAKWGLQHCQSMIIKCDQEHAIVDVARAVAKERATRLGPATRTHLEHAPRGESSSNGFIEAGVKSVEGLVRSMWFYLLACVGGSANSAGLQVSFDEEQQAGSSSSSQ